MAEKRVRRVAGKWLMTLATLMLCHGYTCGEDFSPGFPDRGEVIASYTPDSVKSAFVERGMHRIEGIWQLTNGTVVAIERLDEKSSKEIEAIAIYRVAVLRATQRSIRPGTIIGYIAPGAGNGVYEGKFYTDFSQRRLPSRPKRMGVRLDGTDNRISLVPERSGWRVSLRHSLPWLFKPTVRYNADGSERTGYGGVRVYPAPALPLEPIYL